MTLQWLSSIRSPQRSQWWTRGCSQARGALAVSGGISIGCG
jgi:hypothetical protein